MRRGGTDERKVTVPPGGLGADDIAHLGGWLRCHVGPGEVTGVRALSGGTQNLLVRFDYGGRSLVLRRPPVGGRPGGDEAMRREARVLRALAHTPVPHPRLVGSEPSLEPLGAPFVVMDAVDGVPATGPLSGPYGRDLSWRRRLGASVAAAIGQLGEVDPARVGLADLGRPGPFLARQAGRWLHQLGSYRDTDGYEPLAPAAAARIAAWLDAHLPAEQHPGIVHGDLHLGNVLLATDAPGVAAIVDWELATIGDPLLDLAELLVTWPDDSGRSALGSVADVDPVDGLATEAELVAAYGAASGRDLSALGWYKVLAAFRLASIIEGTWARACAGRADPATGRTLHEAALALMHRAQKEMM